jgi:hypothetical protein
MLTKNSGYKEQILNVPVSSLEAEFTVYAQLNKYLIYARLT